MDAVLQNAMAPDAAHILIGITLFFRTAYSRKHPEKNIGGTLHVMTGDVIGERFGEHGSIDGKSAETSLAVFVFSTVATSVMIALYIFVIAERYHPGNVAAIIPTWAICLTAGTISATLELMISGYHDELVVPIGTYSASFPSGV